MKLTFAVQQGGAVAEITISLSAGGCVTPFDLADMSDEIKLALAPQLAQLSERMRAASIEAVKQTALDKAASPLFRLREAACVYRLTGEVLDLEDSALQARLQERINRLQARDAQAS